MTTTPRVDLGALLDRSRAVITSLQEPNGAYPASPSFSAYRGYCWFRDGSFIADGASAAGEVASASAFHDWCAMVVDLHADRIRDIVEAADAGTPLPDEHMLPARFTFDGGLGADDWWDFQLDGYGTWLWAAAAHAERHAIDPARWGDAAALTVEYLLSSWERPCYDWWEEHDEAVHGSTLGCIAAGLRAAADAGLVTGERAERARAGAEDVTARLERDAVVDGHLVKWIGSDAVDASLSSLIAPLGVVDPASPLAAATLQAVSDQLEVDGGVYRFRADTFFGGGRWPLLSCFLGLAYAAVGDRAEARRLLEWAASTATDAGMLPEQVDGHLLAPEHRQEWIDRWGPVATPLLWSHAMVLRLAAELGVDRAEIAA
ncbi:glycoside hydrolase family 15 protein [Microbacterium sp. BG28]|uniref:glycoside hydrolase family 15 protein n=1 Tax=Microbacterium sp. BG28 TaxID=3097356 RepID=UPI002A59C1AA|nr:glycoside hydrolase family 15 protein [Microbacterium sp. BG28]MDY0829622.1 glycoside hydrolase family 15 protein [Microbacterium sp. BG28]